MSPLDEMIYISQNLEKILQEQYGAVGRGLGEKAKSVENQLPEEVFRKICKLVAWRNKAIHENIDLANKKIESFRRIAWEVCFSLMNNQRGVGSQTVTTSMNRTSYQENSYYPEERPSFWEGPLGWVVVFVILIMFRILQDLLNGSL